ncbi:hypothetical protein PLICRDRAFT_166320 [Plicaturopsis crispa FD-325 SS-3]|nr:hypothetical protein PLICRDRAFT_166320 [Plicaturopsis crispa FD-325 SS-3]
MISILNLDDPTFLSLSSTRPSSIFSTALLAFVAIYYTLAPYYKSTKQLSWILTSVASAAMVLSSVPFVCDYVASKGDVRFVGTHAVWAYAACRVFQAYLVADLLMGFMHYREHLTLSTGWIHHTLYVFIVQLAIRREWTHVFCLCLLMELPTFVLSVASLHPHLRSNLLFAVTFFGTRIAFHAVLIVEYYRVEESVLPAALLACVFPMHAFWFWGCLKGFARRRGMQGSSVIRIVLLDFSETKEGAVLSVNMPGSWCTSYILG